MSDTILSARWVVYYEADNRQKRIERDTSITPTVTDTVNELYSAIQDLMDEITQLDDGSPLSAQTPTEYTIGIIDTGDDDPWFIDNTSVEFLTGGALTTASWTRATSSNTGIVVIEYTDTTGFSVSDIGLTVTNAVGSDSGTLLDFNDTGTPNLAWIRPDTDTAADDWDSTSGNLAVSGGTATAGDQTVAAATGEDLWSNINTIGTVASNTHVYVEQNGSLLTAAKDTTDWWSDGAIDILVKVKQVGVEIDEAVVGVYARQLTKTYSFFSSDLTNGGRTAIPLGTGTDLNAAEGVRQMVLTTGATAEPLVGDVISDDSSPLIIQGVITSVVGTNPNVTLQYYLIGDPLTDFSTGANAFTAAPSGFTSTNVATQTDVNSGVIAGLSIAHNDVDLLPNQPFDVDEDEVNETYSIEIDVSAEALIDAYQWAQYVLRRGGTTTTNTDGIEGQIYLGIDNVLFYGTSSEVGGTIVAGDTVTQETTGAVGIVVGHDDVANLITLRTSRGTFATGSATDHTVTSTENSGAVEMQTSDSATATTVAVNPASPFGTFAGGTWFLARGVVLSNVLAADAQNFITTTDDGVVTTPPNKQALTIANTRALDRIAVFELTAPGGIIDKGQYVSAVAALGDATLDVTNGTKTAIAADTPGKTTGGVLRVVDADLDVEYRIRYASWTAQTFTFANLVGISLTSSDTGLSDTGEAFLTNVLVGDIITHATKGYAYITEVTDNDNLVFAGGTLSGMTGVENYEINAVPVALTTSDNVYVPLLDIHETTGTDASTGTASDTITYGGDIPVLIIARNSSAPTETTIPMLPYSAEATFVATGLSNNVIRTLDSIKN